MAKVIEDPRPTAKERLNKTVDGVQGSQAWSSIFRPGSIFRKGYTDSPRNRSCIDHELGALSLAPGESEASCGQGQLHLVPRRLELLPVHFVNRDGHLLDVLLSTRSHSCME